MQDQHIAQLIDAIRDLDAQAAEAENRLMRQLLAAKVAGIRPRDDRAFGAVFAQAIREGLIAPVGYAPRVKGHGTAGGRVYARGTSL